MKKILITGANGFVGAAICRELSEREIAVIAVVKSEESDVSRIKDLPGIRLVFCDLNNYKELPDMIPDRDIDTVFHLAWAGTSGMMRGDADTQLNNVKASYELIKSCEVLNCRRFIFASSIMEYEVSSLMETDMTPSINTLYSSAKLVANYFSRTVAGNLGMDYIRVVISNIYGPGERSQRLLNSSIRKMLSGEHCSFSSGEQQYDFIYITDAARGFVAAAENGLSDRTYYLGSGDQKPLKEYLICLKDAVDPGISIGLGELPTLGISLNYNEFDTSALERDTGFRSQVSFDEGIRKTIDWIRENG